ncbi:MAG: CsiV family protein [Alcanivoracaceae bacterium]|jgi:hypothetical protein|nr:CsiV family protein [Alcanivoracaceae bacterium]
MRYLLIAVFSLLPALTVANAAAETETASNPYTELSAPELRRKIAAVDEIYKENWYQVELVAFSRRSAITQEYWRLDKRPQLNADNAIHPAAGTPATLPEQSDAIDQKAAASGAWRVIDNADMSLDSMATRMADSGEYRILLQTAWRQPVRERSVAFPVYVRGGDAIAVFPEQPDADGTLPTGADSAGQSGLPPLELNEGINDPIAEQMPDALQVDATEPEFQALLRIHLSRYLHIEPDAWFTDTSADGQRFWVNIDQKRRMRSEELHYLDHPLFGLLVRLMPYETDEQKQLALMEKALKAK